MEVGHSHSSYQVRDSRKRQHRFVQEQHEKLKQQEKKKESFTTNKVEIPDVMGIFTHPQISETLKQAVHPKMKILPLTHPHADVRLGELHSKAAFSYTTEEAGDLFLEHNKTTGKNPPKWFHTARLL